MNGEEWTARLLEEIYNSSLSRDQSRDWRFSIPICQDLKMVPGLQSIATRYRAAKSTHVNYSYLLFTVL